jgi:hypothetical protein
MFKLIWWGTMLSVAFVVGDDRTIVPRDLSTFVACSFLALAICGPIVFNYIRVGMYFKNHEVGTPEDVATSTGLTERQTVSALNRLRDAGKIKLILDNPQLFQSCANKPFKNAMIQTDIDVD